MKQKLQFEQTLKQTLSLSTTMRNSLDILKLGKKDLIHMIHETVKQNPFLEYTPSSNDHNWMKDAISNAPSLQEELYLQLHTLAQPYDEQIADYIINSLDEHGFFTLSYVESANYLHVSLEAFVHTLSLIQALEPVGVAAKDSIDSVIIQLKAQYLDEAAELLQHHQEDLVKHNYEQIAKDRNLSLDEVYSYVEDIQDCNPFPCSQYHSTAVSQIEPDVTIIVEDDECRIEPKDMGELHLQKVDQTQLTPDMKQYFQDAKFFLDHINRRNKTLLLIVNEILEIQKAHFLYNDELQSCTRKQIAQRTGFSESTISRTIQDTYYEYEHTVYPLSNLMVSSTAAGSSKDAICKAILMFIQEEDHEHPYLDEELVNKLEEIELFVSRRAISKYRKQCHIANSKERKKQYHSMF